MENYLQILLVVCPLVFLAGVIDSMAGGGGLISMPAYLLAGLPPHLTYGTNKFASTIGTGIAAIRYARSGKVRWKIALTASVSSMLCGWCAAQVVLLLSERTLNLFMSVCLPLVAVFLFTRKDFGGDESRDLALTPRRMAGRALLVGAVCGIYDGLFGPGTGTFMLLGFTLLLGLDMTTASGNAKVVNLASNLGALMAYLLGGKVLFPVAIPAAICSCLGNYLGARLAIKGGARYIKPAITVVIGMLLVKVAGGLVL